MVRFIVRLLIFGIVIGLSLYIGVQWKLNEDLKSINSKLGGNIQFDYDSSALTLSGNVVISGINLYFRQQDINISINKIKYSAGSIFEMAFLRKQLNRTDYPKNVYLSIDEAVIPLTPSLVKLIAANEQNDTWSAMKATACGRVKQLGINEYFSMGYDYIVFSSEMNFAEDNYSGNLIGSGSVDVEETSRFDFKINLAGFFEQEKNPIKQASFPTIERLEIDMTDTGYNRHKNEYCSSRAGLSTEEYLDQHIKSFAKKLNSVGITMTLSGQRYYRELLLPSSQMHLQIQPQTSFTFADFGFYDEPELRDILGLKLSINQKNVPSVFDGWALDKFNQIVMKDPQSEQQAAKNKRFQNIVIRRSYQPEPVSNASQFIGYEVKVVRDDGREYKGKLQKIDNRRLYVAMPLEGGVVQVPIEEKRVKSLDIYR